MATQIIVPIEWLEHQTKMCEIEIKRAELSWLAAIFSSEEKIKKAAAAVNVELGKLKMINALYDKFLSGENVKP